MAKIKPGKNTSKKDVIITKAAALFRAKGFSAATMRELADAVGIEAPSLYNHIGSKSEILQAICLKVANEFTTQLAAAENLPGNNSNKIELVIRFHISMMLFAVVLITVGSAKAKRQIKDAEKFGTMLTWFSLALLVIFIAIPWPFSPLTSRPLARGF